VFAPRAGGLVPGQTPQASGILPAFFAAATWSSWRSRKRHLSKAVQRRAITDEKDLDVSRLLRKYDKDIKAIRRACMELLEGRDDTYVLRIAIEHRGDIAAATRNMQKVNSWRRREGRQIVAAAAQAVAAAQEGGGWNNAPVLEAAPHSELISKYITGSQIVMISMPNGDLCSCIRASAIDDQKLMDSVTVEQMIEFFLYAREVNFLVAEQRTRRQGRLVQLIAANDLTAVSKLPDDRFQQALTKSSEQTTTLYPGFAGPTAILNVPEVARFILGFLTPLFPGAVQQRLKFATGPMAYITDLSDVLQDPTRSAFVKDLQVTLEL